MLEQLISTGEATHSIKGGNLRRESARFRSFLKTLQTETVHHRSRLQVTSSSSVWWDPEIPSASPNIVLNTIVAEAFADTCDVLEKAEDFDLAVHDLIKKYATENQRIVFNGDGYSEAWVEEAERRGLPNIRSMVEAIPAMVTDKAVNLFERFGVFTKPNWNHRAEIQYETYAKAINIEARTMIDMASKQFMPAFIKYTKTLADTVNAVTAAGGRCVCTERSA